MSSPDTVAIRYPHAKHLCETCNGMGNAVRELCQDDSIKIVKSWTDVDRDSATCAFCRLVSKTASSLAPWVWKEFYIERVWDYGKGLSDIRIGQHGSHCEYFAISTSEGSLPAMRGQLPSRCISAPMDLDRARQWLQDCLRNHDHGQEGVTKRPTRLIAVGRDDKSDPVRIIDGRSTSDDYVALSHCWGTSGTLCLTAVNYKAFCDHIPWDQLPKTFKDAIQVVRGLDYGYIWIDSLCIIQDDPKDWQNESVKMADIYNGATLTIMAAAASDSNGGCFQNRSEPVALPYTSVDGLTQYTVFIEDPVLGYNKSVLEGPLLKRGWVFQERLISRRKLIFGKDQKYWECNTSVLSESKIHDQDRSVLYARETNEMLLLFSNPHASRGSLPHNHSTWQKCWRSLIYEYSLCSLTYDTDRLPSLSGLARTFAKQSSCSYIAGLWLEHLPQALLWRVENAKSTGIYCAPSWSWASMRGQILFDQDEGCPEMEVIETDIQLAGADAYGRVKPSSSLCLQARLCSGRLIRDKQYNIHFEAENGDRAKWLCLDRNYGDLPENMFCLQVTDKSSLILQNTGSDGRFRRIGMTRPPIIFDTEGNKMFHGIERQVVTLI